MGKIMLNQKGRHRSSCVGRFQPENKCREKRLEKDALSVSMSWDDESFVFLLSSLPLFFIINMYYFWHFKSFFFNWLLSSGAES